MKRARRAGGDGAAGGGARGQGQDRAGQGRAGYKPHTHSTSNGACMGRRHRCARKPHGLPAYMYVCHDIGEGHGDRRTDGQSTQSMYTHGGGGACRVQSEHGVERHGSMALGVCRWPRGLMGHVGSGSIHPVLRGYIRGCTMQCVCVSKCFPTFGVCVRVRARSDQPHHHGRHDDDGNGNGKDNGHVTISAATRRAQMGCVAQQAGGHGAGRGAGRGADEEQARRVRPQGPGRRGQAASRSGPRPGPRRRQATAEAARLDGRVARGQAEW